MLTFLTIGSDFATSTMGVIGTLFDDLNPVIFLIGGLSLGVYFVEGIVLIVYEALEKRRYFREEERKIQLEEEERIFKPYQKFRREEIRRRVRKKMIEEA